MIKAAIVILNWNGKQFLQKFLPSVIEYSSLPDVQILIADNGSSDDSIPFLRKNHPSVRIIEMDKNHGFAGGYNLALQEVESDYYILLNSDVEVTEGWIQPIIKPMDDDPSIAACMPKIKDYHRKDHFEYAGAAGGYIDRLGYTFCRGRIFNVVEKDRDQYNSRTEIFWATGACLAIRAQLFHETGGFDTDFFAHMEEIDLCWRLKNRGYRILFSPDSEVFHVGGGSLPVNHPHKTYLNFRNNLFLLYKNLSPHHFRRKIGTRQILDGVAALKFLFGLEFRNFASVIRAHISYFFNIHLLKTKRKNNLEHNKAYDHPEIYPHSIVFDFFFRKKKKFSDIFWF